MLRWAIIFFILAVISSLCGFYGLEGTFMAIAKFLAVLFAVLFIVLVVLGTVAVKKIP